MYMVSLLSILPFTAPACGSAQGGGEAPEAPKVYFVRDITPENMVRLYEALERPATGKVAVKLSTGEPGGHNFLKPELIKDLVQKVDDTIVECNTAYGGGRASTENHLKAAADHGFTAIAPVDIMDAEGEVSLPVKGGRHLRENFVGSHYPAYDFTVVLSHFKGHAMGGFGGAVKNISIGIASSAGKAWIHSAGKTKNAAQMWGNLPAQDDFLESMAEAAKSVADHCGEKILYINVMNNLSVDCDCDAHPEDPKMGDIGILASTDPVALDKACVDLVYASPDPGKVHLIERMESRPGVAAVMAGCRSRAEIEAALAWCSATAAERDYTGALAGLDKFSWEGHCMYCGHCAPCSVGIDIAGVNKYYNLTLAQHEIPETVREHYRLLPHHASECIACGRCERNCPFGVDIIGHMRLAAAKFGY